MKKYLPLFLLSLALLTSLPAADQMICAACGKSIASGTWVEAEGKTYHAEHFTCARCGNPIYPARYYIVDGRPYDSACYVAVHAPRCTYCNQPVIGEWVTDEKGKYHPACYYDHVAPRCISCGQPISGQYFYDEFGGTVCTACKDGIRKCHACGRMLSDHPGESVRLKDNRRLCAHCDASAVSDLDLAVALMETVREDLAAEGIDVDEDVDLELVGQPELASHSHGFLEDRLGVTVYEKAGFLGGLISFSDYKVYILHNLPRDLLRAVLAHELMHVWLFDNGPADHDRLLCEGSCEYAAFLVLARNPSEDSRFYVNRLTENPDPIYGEGFRRVSAMVERGGKEAWLQWLRKNARAPW